MHKKLKRIIHFLQKNEAYFLFLLCRISSLSRLHLFLLRCHLFFSRCHFFFSRCHIFFLRSHFFFPKLFFFKIAFFIISKLVTIVFSLSNGMVKPLSKVSWHLQLLSSISGSYTLPCYLLPIAWMSIFDLNVA